MSAQDVVCVITIMLKVLDGKCKMAESDKRFTTSLYDALLADDCIQGDSDLSGLIAEARRGMSEELRLRVYEERLLAETRLGRPVMKAFKGRLREAGLIA